MRMRSVVEHANKKIRHLESKGLTCRWTECYMNSEVTTSGPFNAVGIAGEWDGQSSGPDNKYKLNITDNPYYDQVVIGVIDNGQFIGNVLFTKDGYIINEFVIGPPELAAMLRTEQ